ncbi:MAG: 50S ribosomal protein L33 [SAR324 cluster bacterium]|uniref:Large ribosomal subunit protein bL33 n=1 Tax=SAR324 cluster bacterium TaxID=2024889 RepID=A0A7X9FPL9_9DELT|nr:50S ribosomal protein L33 [SAR324 cluster bacterium]
MAKAQKETTFLVSSEKTGYFYTNRKNKKKNKGEKKLALKKYDPVARKHVEFAEKKLSKLKVKYQRTEGEAAEASSKSAK